MNIKKAMAREWESKSVFVMSTHNLQVWKCRIH